MGVVITRVATINTVATLVAAAGNTAADFAIAAIAVVFVNVVACAAA